MASPPRSMKAIGVALVLVVGLAGGLYVATAGSASTGGLVASPQGSGVASTIPTGDAATFGTSIVYGEGTGTVTILSVTPINQTGPLEYLGSRLAGPDRGYAGMAVSEGFPPAAESGSTQPSEGARLSLDSDSKGRGWEVLLGYRVLGPGVGSHDGILIEYEVDGERQTVRLPSELKVCEGPRGQECNASEATDG